MSQTKSSTVRSSSNSAGKIEVRLELPKNLYQVTKMVADLAEFSIEEYILRNYILGLEGDLGNPVAMLMYPHIEYNGHYQEQLLAMAGLGD